MNPRPLSDMQLAFMRALWRLGEATVADVQAQLEAEGQALATTTVATVLRRLHRSRHLAYRRRGRQLVYRALVSQEELGSLAIRRLSASLYGGDVGALLTQLVGAMSPSAKELHEVRRLLEAKTKPKDPP